MGEKIDRIFPNGIYDAIYHSGANRTRQTAELAFAEKPVTFIEISDLLEIFHRSTDDMDPKERNNMWDAFVEIWKDEHSGEEIDVDFKYKNHPKDGETYQELYNRVSNALKVLGRDLIKQNVMDPVIIITHNAAMQVLMAHQQIKTGEMKDNEYFKKTGLYPMFFDGSLLPNGAMIKVKYLPATDEVEYIEKVQDNSN